MQPQRILIAIETFLPLVGGSEKQAFLLSTYLRTQGMEATILTMRFQQNWPAYELVDGVPVVRVAGRLLLWRDHLPGALRQLCYLCALLVLCWQLWLRRQHYDILHVFQLTLFTLPALFVCRLTGKPLVIGMRCDVSQAKGNQPVSGEQNGAWAGLEGLARLGRPGLRLINRQLQHTCAHILILSEHMRASLLSYGLDGASITLLPNGVDTTQFYPAQACSEREMTVICVAKMRYQKGIDVLLQAWCQVVAQLTQARLLLVGDGPLLTSLQALAHALGIADSVEFAGLCPDVCQQLQRGSIAVLPSRWEGMPNALLEAMSCGLACVATRVSGSVDLLQDGARGLLVEPEECDELAHALLTLLKDPERAQRYGQAARLYVEQHHSYAYVTQRYLRLYKSF